MLRKACWAAVSLIFLASAAPAEELRVGGTGAAQGMLQRLADAFHASHPGDTVVVIPGLGSSGGISAVIEGALEVAVSGRSLKSDERDKGARSTPLLDTPFVFVTSHPIRQRLSVSQVVDIFDGKLKTWPDGKIIKPLLRPRSDSVSEYLVDNIPRMKDAMERLRRRPDVPVAATDQDNAKLAEQISDSLTAMTLVQFVTDHPKLGLIELDGVTPSVGAMKAGRYPLKTRLHLVRGPQSSAAVDRLVAFLKTPVADKILLDSGAAPSSGSAADH